MSVELKVSIGEYSDKGRKELNQDAHGASIPKGSPLSLKGIAVAIADGISSSQVSHLASETAVKSFLDDYYCTSDAWSVKNSVLRVLSATNSWLYSQGQQSEYRYDKDKGYVCTFSAIVIKSNTVHLFHVGDSRIYRLNANGLEQLTKDHRLWVTQDQSYLSRALGIEEHCEIDVQSYQAYKDDIYILATDGVYEYVEQQFLVDSIQHNQGDLDQLAQSIAKKAYQQDSTDNLTIQIVRVDELPSQEASEVQHQIDELPFPPILDARKPFDGYTILREVHASSRSHVYLAKDEQTDTQVIIKTPSIDLRGDPAYLERLMMEEWIARRINSAYVLKAGPQDRSRNYLYSVTEFIDGQTLAQWIIDNPKPDMNSVRAIVEQIARGLRAFHAMEMLHQDLKPDNIMIDKEGTVKLIDFGSARVAGLVERNLEGDDNAILGTALYSAPECFLGVGGSTRSDLFSLGVITYYMLSGRFPYGVKVARARTVAAQRKLQYQPVLNEEREIPFWVDEAIRKAVHINPYKRYEEISEFIYDLHHPNKTFLNKTRPPLIERDPVAFWKGFSLVCVVIIFYLLSR